MTVINTTTKKFKQGIRITGNTVEVHWESTGHLSVRLLDASGAVPLAGRKVTVEIPGEGTVELDTDADGKLFHPDVPFQDYELKLERGSVHATPVAARAEVQERRVPDVVFAFVRVQLRDNLGFPVDGVPVTVRGPDGTELDLESDEDGLVLHAEPVAPGSYEVITDVGTATVNLPVTGSGVVIVVLTAGAEASP